MKIKTITIMFIAVIALLAITVRAETSVNTSVDATVTTPPPRVPLNDKLRVRAVNNSERRNILVEERKEIQAGAKVMRASSTMMIKGIRASTTMMFKEMKDQKREVIKKMKLDVFENRKNALVKELTVALRNLTSLRIRINERIIKAENTGRSMTDAKTLLVIADDKLAKAKVALDALTSFSYASSTKLLLIPTGASTTIDIDLTKPRKIGDDAIKAIKDARNALKKVIVAVAHSMGLGKENENSTTTPPTTSATTSSSTQQ